MLQPEFLSDSNGRHVYKPSEEYIKENYITGSGIIRNGGHFSKDGKVFIGSEIKKFKGGDSETIYNRRIRRHIRKD